MAAELYTIDAVVFNATPLNAVGSISFQQGVSVSQPDLDGEVNSKFAGIMEVVPEFTFDTSAVMDALGWIDATGEIEGLDLSGVTNGLAFFLSEHGAVGKAPGTGHTKMVVAAGILVPESITLTQGQPATISMRVIPVNASGTDPVAFSTAARPAFSAITTLWTLGKVKINGTAISDDVQSVTINFNYTVERVSGDGRPYPKAAFIITRKPTASISLKNSAALATIGVATALNGTTGLQVYLSAVAADSITTAAATEAHGLITIENGLIHRDGFSGSPMVDNTFTVVARADSSGNIIAFSTGVAQ